MRKSAETLLAHPMTLERPMAEEDGSPAGGADVRPALKVGILLWPEFTMLALAGFIDSLRLAADIGDGAIRFIAPGR